MGKNLFCEVLLGGKMRTESDCCVEETKSCVFFSFLEFAGDENGVIA